MQYGEIRFDTELRIVRGLVELRRHGVQFADLEDELTRLGPVDLDLLFKVMAKISAGLAHALPLPDQMQVPAGDPSDRHPL